MTTPYTYNAADQLTSVNGATVTSDLDGNVTNDGAGGVYAWDARSRLTGLTKNGNSYVFKYGPDNLRLYKSVNGVVTKYLLDGDQVVTETINGVANQTLYGPGTDHPLARNGEFFLPNHASSTTGLTDGSGNLTRSYLYGPFGELLNAPTDSNPFQCTGRENDGDGLLYYRARYYCPACGRFLSSDPAGSGINPYVYAGDNPVNAADPSGLHGDAFDDPELYSPTDLPQAQGGVDPSLANALLYQTRAANNEPVGMAEAGGGETPLGAGYVLRDPEWGNIVRTGGTGDAPTRAAAHRGAPETSALIFDPMIPTVNRMEWRGAEDLLWEAFPEARVENGGLNAQRAIRLNNPKYTDYIWAGINAYLRSIGELDASPIEIPAAGLPPLPPGDEYSTTVPPGYPLPDGNIAVEPP